MFMGYVHEMHVQYIARHELKGDNVVGVDDQPSFSLLFIGC